MTKNLLKIYTRTSIEIFYLITIACSNKKLAKKLNKKPILYKLLKFLPIPIKVKKYNDNDDLLVKDTV